MQKKKNKISYGEKLALAATSLPALAMLPAGAEAGIIHVTGSPVSLSFSDPDGSSALWDVDGAGSIAPIGELKLFRSTFGSSSNNYISFGNLGAGNSILLTYSYSVARLPGSFHVGPFMSGASFYFYNASTGPVLHGGYSTTSGPWIHTHNGFIEGDQFIGFRFTDGIDQFYGYSNWNVNFTNRSVTITDWYYNDVADAAIHVTSVPEPSTASLALIGMGAAGVRAWRRRRKALAA